MNELHLKPTFLLFSIFVFAASAQPTAVKLYLENELILELSGTTSNEWIVETDQNRIIYFSFINNDHVDLQQISPFLTISDGNKPESIIIFPSKDHQKSLPSPFYSTGNTVSIKITKLPSYLNGFQLKAQKAAPCPTDLGGSSSCGRVVDELSCYCGLYSPTRSWGDTKTFCQANGMNFVSIETIEEDEAVFKAFAGTGSNMWIGATDVDIEGAFVWDSTGKKLVPGFVSWIPGSPTSYGCGGEFYDCAYYGRASTSVPAWDDYDCASPNGGICELQP